MAKLISKYVRIALEGATIDGREITAEQISQMAANYDPDIYGARIWLEHFRGLYPESIFGAYGDVIELKTEKDADGKLGLMARLAPTAALIEINKERQKVYTSIEMDTSFSDTNQAYLVGLAVTDTPASKGTEMLKFCKENKADFDFIENDHLYSKAIEINADDVQGVPEKPSLLTRITAMMKKDSDKAGAENNSRFSDFEDSLCLLAKAVQSLQENMTPAPDNKPDPADITNLTSEVAALKKQLADLANDPTPSDKHKSRKEATGENMATQTDC